MLLLLLGFVFCSEVTYHLEALGIEMERPFVVIPDGTIAILDISASQLVLLDNKGNLIKRCSQAGEGPGELSNPTNLFWNAEEQIYWIQDYPNRFSLWSKDGTFIKEHRVNLSLSEPRFKNGMLLMVSDPHGTKGKPTLMKVDPLKSDTQEVWSFSGEVPSYLVKGKGFELNAAFLWDPSLQYGLGSNFIVVGFGNDKKLSVLDPKGTLLRKFDVSLPRSPFHKEQAMTVFADFPDWVRAELLANQPFPEYWAAIQKILVDEKDQIWVFGSPGLDQQRHYNVYNPQGHLLTAGKVDGLPSNVARQKICLMKLNEADEVELKIIPITF